MRHVLPARAENSAARAASCRPLPGQKFLAVRGRTALLWALTVFAGLQVALHIFLEWWHPEVRDTAFGPKLIWLRQRHAREPGQPILLALGSSRVNMGFRPDSLPAVHTAEGAVPLAFNYAFDGGGPITQLLNLQRVLADGLRPTWVVLEILPPWLTDASGCTEEVRMKPFLHRFGWREVWQLQRYLCDREALYRRWGPLQLAPCHTHRCGLLGRYARPWLLTYLPGGAWTEEIGNAGWLPHFNPDLHADVVAAQAAGDGKARAAALRAHWSQSELQRTLFGFGPALQAFQVAPAADRALRDALSLCRREGIVPLLLLMPETKELRALYPPKALARLDAYLALLSREYGVAVADARTWVPDGRDYFVDGHHLSPDGAALFSSRFGAEIYRPLVEGRRNRTMLDGQLSEPVPAPR